MVLVVAFALTIACDLFSACRHGTRSDTTSAGPEAPDEDDAVAPLAHHYDPERKGVKLHWCLKRGSIVRVWWKGHPPCDCRLILSGDGRTFVRANRGEFQGDIPMDLRRDEWKFVRRTCKKDNIEDKCLNCILPWRKLKCQCKSHLHHPDDFADKCEGANASHRPNQSLEDAMHVRQAAPRTRTNQELIVLLDQLKMRVNSCQRMNRALRRELRELKARRCVKQMQKSMMSHLKKDDGAAVIEGVPVRGVPVDGFQMGGCDADSESDLRRCEHTMLSTTFLFFFFF